MSYNTMDHADWVQDRLTERRKHYPNQADRWPAQLTEFQKKVIDILGMVGGGIYNAPIDLESIDWDYGFNGMSVLWNQRDMATWDFQQLTMLVFLCHAARIRCELEVVVGHQGYHDPEDAIDPKPEDFVSPLEEQEGEAYGLFRLSFWQRQAKGDMSRRHPNLAEAMKWFEDEYLPKDHRVRYAEAGIPPEGIA